VQIDKMEVEFNARIASVSTTNYMGQMRALLNSTSGASGGLGSASKYLQATSMTAMVSTQQQTKGNSKDQREYSIQMKVTAEQDELPAGVYRILSALEDSITTKYKNL
jgi:hypothetical protein